MTKRVEKYEEKHKDTNTNGPVGILTCAWATEEGEAGTQQRQNHARIRHQEQEPPAIFVDPPVCGKGEEEVRQTEAPAEPQGADASCAVAVDVLYEDGGIEGYNIAMIVSTTISF